MWDGGWGDGAGVKAERHTNTIKPQQAESLQSYRAMKETFTK